VVASARRAVAASRIACVASRENVGH